MPVATPVLAVDCAASAASRSLTQNSTTPVADRVPIVSPVRRDAEIFTSAPLTEMAPVGAALESCWKVRSGIVLALCDRDIIYDRSWFLI